MTLKKKKYNRCNYQLFKSQYSFKVYLPEIKKLKVCLPGKILDYSLSRLSSLAFFLGVFIFYPNIMISS